MGFRACELNSGESQFSPATSLRFPFSDQFRLRASIFFCIFQHIFLTGYNELFLKKGIK